MNMRLLLRNKGYLVLLVILPIVAVLMLNTSGSGVLMEKDAYAVQELDKDTAQILTIANSKMNVKVYDSSNTEFSDYLIDELAKTGSFEIYRYRSGTMDIDTAREKALASANRNVIGAVIYIPASFEEDILSGSDSRAVVFEATGDGRIQLLEENFDTFLKNLYNYAAVTGYQKEELLSLLHTFAGQELKKNTVSVEVGDALNLSNQQQDRSSSIGYSLAFLSIAFLFSGVFIAATIVDERNNRVYNRFMLSPISMMWYGLVKLALIVMTNLLQTGIIAVAVKLIVKTDFGISYPDYLFLVFCLGLIFNLFSVVIGVITNNVLDSSYIVFLVWCLSCLLAGLYFPLDAASSWWTKVSLLMPQRWVVKTGEMLMAGRSDAFRIFIPVVIGYLFIIMSVGFMGITIRKKD
jgi:ABC-2 type transport system permease protein